MYVCTILIYYAFRAQWWYIHKINQGRILKNAEFKNDYAS